LQTMRNRLDSLDAVDRLFERFGDLGFDDVGICPVYFCLHIDGGRSIAG